jgi:DNA repair protein RadC
VPEPSASDRALTNRLKEALALAEVRVLDHIIIGGADAVSLAERGLI